MSILVKGVEMPRRCEECCICHYEEQGTIVWCGCRATMRIRPVGCDSKPDFCPLIEIPPHGRLIDAEALHTDYFVPSTTSNTPNYYYVSKEQIDNAPTIIEAEQGEE